MKFQVTVVRRIGHDVLEARAKAEANGWTIVRELAREESEYGGYITFLFEVTKEAPMKDNLEKAVDREIAAENRRFLSDPAAIQQAEDDGNRWRRQLENEGILPTDPNDDDGRPTPNASLRHGDAYPPVE